MLGRGGGQWTMEAGPEAVRQIMQRMQPSSCIVVNTFKNYLYCCDSSGPFVIPFRENALFVNSPHAGSAPWQSQNAAYTVWYTTVLFHVCVFTCVVSPLGLRVSDCDAATAKLASLEMRSEANGPRIIHFAGSHDALVGSIVAGLCRAFALHPALFSLLTTTTTTAYSHLSFALTAPSLRLQASRRKPPPPPPSAPVQSTAPSGWSLPNKAQGRRSSRRTRQTLRTSSAPSVRPRLYFLCVCRRAARHLTLQHQRLPLTWLERSVALAERWQPVFRWRVPRGG